jgi:hypothetical protein
MLLLLLLLLGKEKRNLISGDWRIFLRLIAGTVSAKSGILSSVIKAVGDNVLFPCTHKTSFTTLCD